MLDRQTSLSVLSGMNKIPVKERLIQTAEKLFYKQGYRATGINQIIKEAEVAKASFYQYFPSKEALCAEYLRERHISSHKRQKEYISKGKTVQEKICSLLENITDNAVRNNFNGCPFLNILSEINEHESEIRQIVTTHKSRLIELIRNELTDFENKDELAEMIFLVYEGANIAVKNYRDLWPVSRAAETISILLTERGEYV